jgi:LPS O-antigen subunit length determinant protein (WzzB/FepE family)
MTIELGILAVFVAGAVGYIVWSRKKKTSTVHVKPEIIDAVTVVEPVTEKVIESRPKPKRKPTAKKAAKKTPARKK